MSNRVFFSTLAFTAVLVIAALCIGCGADGDCTYNENSPQTGTVDITSIEQDGEIYVVVVEGLFNTGFRLSSDVYQSCIVDKGYDVGSSVPACRAQASRSA